MSKGLLLFVTVIGLALPAPTLAASVSDYQREGLELAQKGDKAGAIRKFREAERLEPRNAQVQYSLGVLLDCGSGNAHFEKAATLDKGYWKASFNLGLCHQSFGQLLLAERSFRRALETTDQRAIVLDALALVVAAQGQTNEAINLRKEAKSLSPNDPSIRYNLGNDYIKDGQTDAGLTELKKALELNPQHCNAALNIAEVFGDKRQYDKQLEYLKKALEIDPKRPAPYINHTRPLLEKNRRSDAYDYLVKGATLAVQQRDAVLAGAALTNLRTAFPDDQFAKKLAAELNADKRTMKHVQAAFSRSKEDIYRVFSEAQQRNSQLRGKIVFKFSISPEGRVVSISTVESTLNDKDAPPALEATIAGMDFGRVLNPEITTFTYPMSLSPN